jgi:hypothetical protein
MKYQSILALINIALAHPLAAIFNPRSITTLCQAKKKGFYQSGPNHSKKHSKHI